MQLPSLPIIIAVISTTLVTISRAQACAAGSGTGTAQEINGNWYCSQVSAITYQNFPGHGYYNRVTNMDADTGECSSQAYAYSGSLSPLNEEVCFFGKSFCLCWFMVKIDAIDTDLPP